MLNLVKSGPYVVYSFQSSHLQWPNLARRLQHPAVYITGHLCFHLPAGGVFFLGLWAVSFFSQKRSSHSFTDFFLNWNFKKDSNTVGNIASVASVDWGCAVQIMAAASIGSDLQFTATTAQTL